MITLQDHIEELRAQLRGCLDARERDEIAIEDAIAALDEKNRAVAADRSPG